MDFMTPDHGLLIAKIGAGLLLASVIFRIFWGWGAAISRHYEQDRKQRRLVQQVREQNRRPPF